MLPNFETVNSAAPSGGVQPGRRETDKVTEAYRTVPLNSESANVADKTGVMSDVQRQSRTGESSRNIAGVANRDQAELNLSLTREERDAFISVFSSKQDPMTMSEREKAVLQEASERISKYIDDAIAKNEENRNRVEKAVGEWYSRISKGDRQGPVELINLLRAAAVGDLDKMYEN